MGVIHRAVAVVFLLTIGAYGRDVLGAPQDIGSASLNDPASRGLDLLVQIPSSVVAGGTLPVQVQAVGFPTISTVRPLADANIDVSWDESSLPGGIDPIPAMVSARCDAEGRAHLNVGVPEVSGHAKLLLRVRHGDHERVREVEVEIEKPVTLSLYVSQQMVSPGSTISTWAFVRRADTGLAAAGTEIEFDLSENGYVRQRAKVDANREGFAITQLAIPELGGPAVSWEISAHANLLGRDHVDAHTKILARDESPGVPRMDVHWGDGHVEPGEPAPFAVTARDGSGEPVSGLAIRYRVRVKSTETASDGDNWDNTSTPAMTDAAGAFQGSARMPSIGSRAGQNIEIEVRAVENGHLLSDSATFHLISLHSPVGVSESSSFGISLIPETRLVSGIEQRLYLSVQDHGKPLEGSFLVEGDGLSERARTNRLGYAEITWNVPVSVGAHHQQGDCAEGVAAEIRVRPMNPPGGSQAVCVPVDRDAELALRVVRPVVRSGDPVAVHILGRAPAMSLFAQSRESSRTVSQWVAAGEHDVALSLPADAHGIWTITPVISGRKKDKPAGASVGVLVVPKRLPKLVVSQIGGRVAPGGMALVDAQLVDGSGAAMPGTVAAFVFDATGADRDDVFGLEGLDTRTSLVQGLPVADQRDAFLESGDAVFDPLRHAALANLSGARALSTIDPAADLPENVRQTFDKVIRSFEGAVRQSQPEEVRRKGRRGWELNPELDVVMREALGDSANTPGGEPIKLSDLQVIDRQVDFDHAAQRVTRDKLLRVLARVRQTIKDQGLTLDEPILRDPNAMLRRMVRDQVISEGDLLDPWGGTIQFIPDHGPRIPFLSLVPGYSLHAPGPDGRLGTADDLRDPFARVLRTGSPYAQAVHEDELVDAKWNLVVGDDTVKNWQDIFKRSTGQSLLGSEDDSAGEVLGSEDGSSGEGEGGGGRGEGFSLGGGGLGVTGHGAGGGRSSSEYPTYSRWLSPVRTDAQGRARLTIPLGPVESTWKVWLVGLPDDGLPATTSIAIATTLPLSVRVDTGGAWTEGDRGDLIVTVRNRTRSPAHAIVSAEPRSNAALEDPSRAAESVTVAPGGAYAVHLRVRATRPGLAVMAVTVRAPGIGDDAVVHDWPVRPAGEQISISNTAWVDRGVRLAVPLDADMRSNGPPRLVLERGVEGVLRSVLDSLHLDDTDNVSSLGEVVEIVGRLHRYFVLHDGENHPATLLSHEILARATARLLGKEASHPEADTVERAVIMASPWWAQEVLDAADNGHRDRSKYGDALCPKDATGSQRDRAAWLDAAPLAIEGATLSCWDAWVSTTMQSLLGSSDPVAVGLAVLSLGERPERRMEATALVAKLRELTTVRPSGEISLAQPFQADRASRAIVLAALLQTVSSPPKLGAPPDRLVEWLVMQRDARGGFGSLQATRLAVRALSTIATTNASVANVRLLEVGKDLRKSAVAIRLDSERQTIPLDPHTSGVLIQTDGRGVVARIEQPVLRSWANAPAPSSSLLRVDAVWPDKPRAGHNGMLRVSLQQTFGYGAVVRVWIPLPPGVGLSEPMADMVQIRGAIGVTVAMAGSISPTLLSIPIRYAIPGTFTAPEIVAYVEDAENVRAYAPARPMVVEP